MNKERIQSNEFQLRLESEDWSQRIAESVSVKYEVGQQRNRFIIGTLAFLFLMALSGIAYFVPDTFGNSSVADLDFFNVFFSDEFSPIYHTVYQDEGISSIIEPISFLVK